MKRTKLANVDSIGNMRGPADCDRAVGMHLFNTVGSLKSLPKLGRIVNSFQNVAANLIIEISSRLIFSPQIVVNQCLSLASQ